MKKLFPPFFLTLSCLILICNMAVLADNNDVPQDTLMMYQLDEVVVTSSKETNKLRKLPGSVSILTPQQIDGRQVASIKDLSALVPNLYMPDYGAKLTSAIYIRGVGTRSSGQSVGLYVDNAPYLDKSSFDFELMDIQRIEALRGPQGTLYGRNAMGGIINVYTLSPFVYHGIRASLLYGNYGQLTAKSSYYTMLNPQIGFAAGLYYDRNDGFFTNAYTGKRIDNAESVGGNIKLQWNILPSLTASYTASYEYSDQGAFPYGLYNTTTKKIAQVNINDESTYKRSLLNNNLSINYRNEAVEFNSVTSYQYLDDDMKMDQDFSIKSIFILNQIQNKHTFTEELSLKSILANDYQWSMGLYGFYDRLHTKGPVEFKKDGIDSILQPVFDNLKVTYPRMPTLSITNESIYIPGTFNTPTFGAAIYHQSTYNNLFTEGLSATLGVRLDYEKQDFKYDSEAKMNLSMQMSTTMPPMDISDRYPTSVINETLSQDFWQVLPKVSLKYEYIPRIFAYLSAAKGYKAGGYNIQMSADIMQSRLQYDVMYTFRDMFADLEITPPLPVKDVISYKPETSWNYELGIKSELLVSRLHAELTFFYMGVDNLQITKFVESGSGRYLSNAGKAKSYGVEMSLHSRITDHFTVDLNYGHTNATFLDYFNEIDDFNGNFIPYIPQNTFSLGLQYNKIFLNNRIVDQFFASLQCNGTGKIYWHEANNLSQPFYTVVNAQTGVRKGNVSFSVWTRNLFNNNYSSFYFESFDKPFMQKGKPLQFGIKLAVDIDSNSLQRHPKTLMSR